MCRSARFQLLRKAVDMGCQSQNQPSGCHCHPRPRSHSVMSPYCMIEVVNQEPAALGRRQTHMVIHRTLAVVALAGLGALAACGSDDQAGQRPSEVGSSEASSSTLPDIPYFDSDLAGLCESMEASFAEGEPSPFLTPDAALANLARQNTGLEGLQLRDGKVLFDGESVGSYQLIDRPEGTFDVESAQWCYDDPGASDSPPAETDEAVGAAAAARLFVDNSFGGQDVFERINVIDNFGTNRDGFVVSDPDSPIPLSTRYAIEAALAPMPVTWITDASSVIVDESSDYTEVGAVLSIATPIVEGDTAQVTTSLWCGGTCGIGGTHEVRQDGAGWSVVGTVGPQWIS